jgi:hypothetical protein
MAVIAVFLAFAVHSQAQTNIVMGIKGALDQTKTVFWNGATGAVYQVESADSLGDVGAQGLQWVIRDSGTAAKGTNAEWMDVGDPQWIPHIFHPRFQPQRFYRVKNVGQATGTPLTVTMLFTQATSPSPSGTNQVNGDLDYLVSVTLNDTNQQISSVKVFVDGQKLANASSTNFTGSINTTEWPNGTHEIYAVATAVDVGAGDVGMTTADDDSQDETTNAVKMAIGVSGSRFGVFANYISQFFVAVPFFQAGQTQEVVASFEEDSYWRVKVVNYQDTEVRRFEGQGSSAYAPWDGNDQSGSPLPYGYYDYIVEARPSRYGILSSTAPLSSQQASSVASQSTVPLSGAQLRAFPYKQTLAAMQFSRTNITVTETIIIPSLNPTNQPSGTNGGGSPPSPAATSVSSTLSTDSSSSFSQWPPMPPVRTNINGVWTTVPWEDVYGPPPIIEMPVRSTLQTASIQSDGLTPDGPQPVDWADTTYTTRTPNRTSGNLFHGYAGTVGVGYQGHHPTKKAAGNFGSAPGGVLASAPPWGPLVTASALANGFSGSMAYAGWRTSFLLADDNLNSKDLQPPAGGGSGTGTFATRCNFGFLVGHMTSSVRSDPNYFATVPYYPVYNTAQPGHYQWMALPGMDLGNGGIFSKLRWMAFYGCQSLKEKDYTDLWTKFLLPMPPNLRLILGSEDGVFIHPAFGPRFSDDLNGLTTPDGSPMSIFDAWCDAAADTDNKMSHSGWHNFWPLGTRRMTCIYRDTTQGASWNTLNDSIWNWGSDVSYDWFDVSFTVRQVY